MHLSSKDHWKPRCRQGLYAYLITHWVCTWPPPFLSLHQIPELCHHCSQALLSLLYWWHSTVPHPCSHHLKLKVENTELFFFLGKSCPDLCSNYQAVVQDSLLSFKAHFAAVTRSCMFTFIMEDQTLLTQIRSLSRHQSSQSLTTITPSILASRHAHWSPWTIHNVPAHCLPGILESRMKVLLVTNLYKYK